MKVSELVDILKYHFDDDDEVMVFYRVDGKNILDGVVDVSRNGRALQINTDSVDELFNPRKKNE